MLKSPTVTVKYYQMTVMYETAYQCCGKLVIIEYPIPLTEFYICCNNQAAFFITVCNYLKE